MTQVQEETPVTTTDNAGQGLDSPKLPITPGNLFRRFKTFKQKKESDKTLNNSTNK